MSVHIILMKTEQLSHMFYGTYQVTSLKSFFSYWNSVKWIFAALPNYYLM